MFRHGRLTVPTSTAISPAWKDTALPLIPFLPDWSPSVALVATEERPAPAADRLTLIFAEADLASRALICGLCSEWGYEVTATRDGREALEAVNATSGPAIAVVNQNMDEMSGMEFCRAARQTNKHLYIILVTERSATAQLAAALGAGADDYLISPFDADELQARLRVAARVISLQTNLAAHAGAKELSADAC